MEYTADSKVGSAIQSQLLSLRMTIRVALPVVAGRQSSGEQRLNPEACTGHHHGVSVSISGPADTGGNAMQVSLSGSHEYLGQMSEISSQLVCVPGPSTDRDLKGPDGWHHELTDQPVSQHEWANFSERMQSQKVQSQQRIKTLIRKKPV